MKTYLHALAMCQGMFCAIPFPGGTWDEKARGKMLLFLPLVGLEMGVLWAGLAWVCRYFDLHFLISGLVLSVYPYLVTGFLHLDGFMDVKDAIGSYRSLERRREILKDSHVGSFAVIGLALLVLAQFALFASAPEGADSRILLLIPVVSRACSALAVTVLPAMSTSQYAAAKPERGHIWLLTALLGIALACGFLLTGRYGLVLAGELAGYALALGKGYRSLEGMNGDISGYALSLGELTAVAVYALL